ncbi:MAG: hypothetical protein HZB38_00360 [Planctomycetes bacterium]|nr:hypothetical protein [Planctomycetota bacterium]
MSRSSFFTRLLCTSAVGLVGLAAYGSETPAAKSNGAPQSANPISLSASAAGAMGSSKTVAQQEKIDPAVVAKQQLLAKGIIPTPPAPGPGQRSPNDNCVDAFPIACGGTVTGDTTGDTTDGIWPCAAGGSDEWFYFVATGTAATVSLCGSSYDTAVMVLDACGGVVLNCNDDFCGLQSQLDVTGLTVGNTYLIAVGGFASSTGAYTMTLTCGSGPGPCLEAQPQPGDVEELEPFGGCAPDYVDAFNGGCNSSPPVFSPIACGQSFHGESGTFLVGGSLQYRDTDWWLFDVTAPGAIVTLTATGDFPIIIGFVAQPCPQSAFMAYATGATCTATSVTSACLPPGQYVAFVAPNAFSGVPCGSQYRATLSCTPCEPPPAPVNNNCADAIPMACGSTVSGSTVNATTDGAWPCAGGGSDVWYSFVAADSVAVLDLCGSFYDTAVMVTDGCGGAVLGCNDDSCGLQSQLSVGGLTVGNTYLIAVGGYAAGTGDYSMSLTCGIPPCTGAEPQPGDVEELEPFGGCAPDYTDAFNGGCNSSPPVFSPIACGQSFHGETGTFLVGGSLQYRDTDWWLFDVTGTGAIVTLTATGDFPILIGFVAQPCPQSAFMAYAIGNTCTETSVTSACLPPGQYVAFVAPSGFTGVPCGSQYRATLTCTPCEPPPPPANDDCTGATLMSCGDTVIGDNTNALNDGIIPSCSFGGAATNSDVWYKFVADSASATVSLCGGGTLSDTVVSLYDGCGGAELACNDDFCGLLSETTAAGLTPGNTYYIRVAGWGAAAQGTFTLSLTACGATGACCISGDCSIMSPSACAAAGGTYQGDGTSCGGVNYVPSTCADALEDISATGAIAATASGCDDCGETLALPWGFTFFGNTYNSVGVASNGYLTFGATTGDFSNDPIPSANTPNDMIAPFWDDWNTATGGDVYYEARTSPNRFIVQWNRVIHFGGTTGENTFQAILYQDGSIDLRQGTMDATFGNSGSIGIEDSTGATGIAFGATPTDPGTSGACYHIAAESTGNPCGCVCPGDMNGDGLVDISDLALFLSSFGTSAPNIPTPCADINGDGLVDISDLALFLSAFGSTCP